MKHYGYLFPALIGVLIVALGCDATDNENESNRSVIVVNSINDGNPFFSDVLDQGDTLFDVSGAYFALDDFVVEDLVPVSFFNRPYDQTVITGPGLPYGDFLVTSYDITWTELDNNSSAGPLPISSMNSVNNGTNIFVQSGGVGLGSILLVPFSQKTGTSLWILRHPAAPGLPAAAGGEITALANITFRGHEVGTDHEILIPTSLLVSFGDVIEVDP